jgi:hypothetical protein
VGVDRWQVGDLVAPRLAIHHAPARGESVIAMATRVRKDDDLLIHSVEWHQGPAVSRMTQLAARLPATFRAAAPFPLKARETIGRRRLRGRRRILLPQGELALEIRDLSIALCQFLAQALILSLQSLDFLRLAIIAIGGLLRSTRAPVTRPSRPLGTHAPYSPLVVSACTA